MHQVFKVGGLAAALAFSGAALAEGPQWTYGQIGYWAADSVEAGGVGGDVDAFDIRGSLGFADIGHGQLRYFDGSSEIGGGDPDFDFDGFELRGGVHPAINETTDFVAELFYIDADGDDGTAGSDGELDGFGVTTGVRQVWNEVFEWHALISWSDLDVNVAGLPDGEVTDFGAQIGGRWHFNQNFSAGLSLAINDVLAGAVSVLGGDSATFDLRYSFGGDVL